MPDRTVKKNKKYNFFMYILMILMKKFAIVLMHADYMCISLTQQDITIHIHLQVIEKMKSINEGHLFASCLVISFSKSYFW